MQYDLYLIYYDSTSFTLIQFMIDKITAQSKTYVFEVLQISI